MTIDKPVVTIFEMYGSGASEVGPAVARALGVPWVSQAYSSEDLEAAEGRGAEEDNFLTRILATLGRTAASADVGVFSGQLEMLDAEDAVRELRVQCSEGAVVLGRNATVIMADEPRALPVKLDGPIDVRVARAAEVAGLDLAHARARQVREDSARAAMSQRLFNWDPRHNDHFDLVVNTGQLSLTMTVDLILAAYRLKAGSDF